MKTSFPLRRPFAWFLFALLAPHGALAQRPAPSGAPAPEVPASPALGRDGPLAEALTFDAAVKRALDRNPTALQAAAEITRAHALLEQARAASLPTLTGVGTYTRLDANRFSGPLLLQPDSAVNLTAVLAVPLVNPRGWASWDQASEQVAVTALRAEDVRRTLAIATARAYLAVITQKRLHEAAVTARDNAKAHYDFTRTQRTGGVGNTLDEARAAQELTTEEVTLQSRETALFRAREALGVLVAGEGAVDVSDWAFGGMPMLSEATSEAQTARADVRARVRAEKAAERRVDQAYADYLPLLSLTAAPFYQSVPVATTPATGWEAQLALTLPIYDGGLRYGQEHERRALADEARLDVEGALRQAKSEVRSAFEEMERADIALRQAQQSAAFAQKALELASTAYRGGATTELEVIDAERQARDAATQTAIAEDAAREGRLDLLAASGRFPAAK
ncbi:MAG TPA: TolC family protein [Polyangiaceae bacterium]|jgi:outer membrane protein TolC